MESRVDAAGTTHCFTSTPQSSRKMPAVTMITKYTATRNPRASLRARGGA